MPVNYVKTLEIASEVARIIRDTAALSPAPLTVQVGSLADYPTPQDLSSILPAVLVRPITCTPEYRTLQLFSNVDELRVVYVEEFATVGVERTLTMLAKGALIMQAVMATHNLSAFDCSNGVKVMGVEVTPIEWEPREEAEYLAHIQSPVRAIALTVKVLSGNGMS